MKIISQLIALLISFSSVAFAYETDQYSAMFHDLKDSTDFLDKVVNDGLQESILSWRYGHDEAKLMKTVFKKFSSREFERWVNESKDIDSVVDRGNGIYKTTGFFNSPIIRWKGLASTVKVNDVYVGSDKLSHFFGVGQRLYHIAMHPHNESEREREFAAIEDSLWTEHFYWGRSTTRVFSNADLVANYEGYHFYRNLLHDDPVSGRKAIFVFENGRPKLQRKFSFRDYVNDYWSEALNPNRFYGSTRYKVVNVLRTFCERPEYLKNPDRFQSKDEAMLEKRYAHLRLNRDPQRLTLNGICRRMERWEPDQKKEFLTEEQEEIESYKSVFGNDPVRFSDRSQNIQDLVQPFPGCQAQTDRALAEFDVVLKWEQNYTNYLHSILKQNLKQNVTQIRSLLSTPTQNVIEQEVKILQLLAGNLNLKFAKNANIETGPHNYSGILAGFKGLDGRPARVEIFHKRLDDGQNYFCQSSWLEGLDIKGEYDDPSEAKLTRCFVLENDGTLNEGNTNYVLRNRYRTRTSQEGFYDLNDKIGFVYRSISNYCKWY